MEKIIETVQILRRDSIPFNVVTLEDEKIIRHLFSIPEPEITFDKTYSKTRINIVIAFTKQEIKKILYDRENLEEIMLKNEYMLLSELNILTQGKELAPAVDDLTDISPAEQRALDSDKNFPVHLLKNNLISQSKIPIARSVRITGRYSALEKTLPDEE